MANFLFVMVGKNDNPIFQLESAAYEKSNSRHMNEFIVHSSLDVVDELLWKSSSMYMKVVHKFGDRYISAFVTAGNIKFMLLHDFRNEDGIKNFFTEAYELFMKIQLNPFYKVNSPISSPAFESRMRAIAKKYLRQ